MRLLDEKAAAAATAADNADGVASAAMSAAESAVREEMEAAAVAKSTATALSNVLAELKDIGVSFDNADKLERSLEAKGVSKVTSQLNLWKLLPAVAVTGGIEAEE